MFNGSLFLRTLATLLLSLPLSVLWAGDFLEKTYKERYTYKVYVSDNPRPAPPLMVMLHGCWQDADRFAANVGMNALADQHGFIVLYPEQPYHLPGRWPWEAFTAGCWRWFDPENQQRGGDELARIVAIVDTVVQEYAVDTSRVYAAGISAGAAMSVNLAVAYPDKFAAIGVSAGLAYQAATSLYQGLKAMRSPRGNANSLGVAAYQAMGNYARVIPVIVFHGADDSFVAASNSEQVIAQWAQTNDLALDGGVDDDDIDDIADSVAKGSAEAPNGHAYTAYTHTDQSGRRIMVRYLVENMGHAWSGGSAEPLGVFLYLTDPFVDPRGPNASRIMWSFFVDYKLEQSGFPQ